MSVMIQIAGMIKPHHRLKKYTGSGLPGSPLNHFLMGAMKICLSMKTDYPPPAIKGKTTMGLGRRQAQFLKILVNRQAYSFQTPTCIPLVPGKKAADAGMRIRIISTIDTQSFPL
jgi:hypothetical protein